MTTPLEESILESFHGFIKAVGEKKHEEADKIYEQIKLLLAQEPHDSKLFIPFLEMYDDIRENDNTAEELAIAYNALVYEFKKNKYPEQYKDEKS